MNDFDKTEYFTYPGGILMAPFLILYQITCALLTISTIILMALIGYLRKDDWL